MRNSTSGKFHWPAVLDDKGNLAPLPAGSMVDMVVEGSNGAPFPTGILPVHFMHQTDEPRWVGSSVIDPMAIPVAPAISLRDGDPRYSPGIKPNWLECDFNDGLWVHPLMSVTNGYISPSDNTIADGNRGANLHDWVEEDHFHQYIVTCLDLMRAFKDCDGNPVKIYDRAQQADLLVTCAILRRELKAHEDAIRLLIDQFSKYVESRFDASNATPDVQPGAADAGTDQSQDQHIPFQLSNGITKDGTGTDESSYASPRITIRKNAVTPMQVIAIDVFNVGGDTPTYQGTYYRGVGALDRRGDTISFILEEIKTAGFIGAGQARNAANRDNLPDWLGRTFVVRKLRQGESAVNVRQMGGGIF